MVKCPCQNVSSNCLAEDVQSAGMPTSMTVSGSDIFTADARSDQSKQWTTGWMNVKYLQPNKDS